MAEERNNGEEMDWDFLNSFIEDESFKDPTILESVSIIVFKEKDQKSFLDIQPYLTDRTAKETIKAIRYRLPFNEPEIMIELNLN